MFSEYDEIQYVNRRKKLEAGAKWERERAIVQKMFKKRQKSKRRTNKIIVYTSKWNTIHCMEWFIKMKSLTTAWCFSFSVSLSFSAKWHLSHSDTYIYIHIHTYTVINIIVSPFNEIEIILLYRKLQLFWQSFRDAISTKI